MTDDETIPFVADINRETLRVPDRFEALESEDPETLRVVVVPVEDSLAAVDDRFRDIAMADRGGLMILKGVSGAGKTTFAQTVALFRERVSISSIDGDTDISAKLQEFGPSDDHRIIVIGGREALGEVSHPAIEASLHSINTFVRSDRGRNTLVIWPVNTQSLADLLSGIASELGGEALLGTTEKVHTFAGPPRSSFAAIADRTIGALNESASLANLGITEDRAQDIANECDTIGHFLARVARELAENMSTVRGLLPAEQMRVWTVVVAGNDGADGAVYTVTRGRFAYVDIDRMMTSTRANIVTDLQNYPDKIGILGTVLDARIIHLDVFAALAIAREFGDETLKRLMSNMGMSTDRDDSALTRIRESVLAKLLTGSPLGTGRRGRKPGSNTATAFAKLSEIASINDTALNRAVGEALKAAGLIQSYEVEKEFGKDRKYYSDLFVITQTAERIRLEFMWRKSTGSADVSNYVLKKLESYGKAIGLLN